MKLFISCILLLGLVPLTQGCKDPDIDAFMDQYCTCLDKNKKNPEGRFECIQLMDSIQKVYENQPRKLNKIIQNTSNCW